MSIIPDKFHSTFDKLQAIMKQYNWQVMAFGSENLPISMRTSLQSPYNLTNLYVRTKPDLLVVRDGFNETYLIECKDLTKTGTITGNLAVEAIPWFICRHLQKIGIDYLYAIDLNNKGIWLFSPSDPLLSNISTVMLPNLHKEYFKKHVLANLQQSFPETHFRISEINVEIGSQDPFLLVPIQSILLCGRTVERFAKWGWK